MINQTPSSFALFWDANRGNVHKQNRALGLLEKQLVRDPHNTMAQVCKACLMIQLSHETDRIEHRQGYVSVALDIIRDSPLPAPMPDQHLIEFMVGISLAQLPDASEQNEISAGILQHLIASGGLARHFPADLQQEAYVALGSVLQSCGEPKQARQAFEKAKQHGRTRAVDIFEDYQYLKHTDLS